MSFNIETYLNSLPLDIKIINISSRNLTYLPDLSRFTKLIRFDCSYNYLIELPPLNNTLILLFCHHNRLTSLPPLNKTLTDLYCHHNRLTSLPPLNKTLTHLYCYHNQLTWLPHLNNTLTHLDCSYNYLIELPPLNHNLVDLVCYNNDLTELPPLNHNLKYLNCRYNKIYNENIEKYKHDYPNKLIIKTLRDFKYTYYCLKFKKYFKIWLWEKVREPKIKLKFHPSHLNALEEIDDLEDLELFLDNWINK